MSGFCEIVLAMGMSIFGLCAEDATAAAPPLPKNEESVWNYKAPEPEPAPPPAPPPQIPAMPPVIITKVIKEEAPPPLPPMPMIEEPKADPRLEAFKMALMVSNRIGDQAYITAGRQDDENSAAGVIHGITGQKMAALKGMNVIARGYAGASAKSGLPVDNSRIFTADRYISGILETGINSQLDSNDGGGELIIQTSRDLFGYHNRNILIPKGSRVICDYQSPKKAGMTRISVKCKRILMAGHRLEIIGLGAPAGDQQGRAGLSGDVDYRFWEKYGDALMLSAVSATVRLAGAAAVRKKTDDDASTLGTVASEGSKELSEKFGEITASVLEETVNLKPIITIPQGTRVQIRPRKDWLIAEAGGGRQ